MSRFRTVNYQGEMMCKRPDSLVGRAAVRYSESPGFEFQSGCTFFSTCGTWKRLPPSFNMFVLSRLKGLFTKYWKKVKKVCDKIKNICFSINHPFNVLLLVATTTKQNNEMAQIRHHSFVIFNWQNGSSHKCSKAVEFYC
jgi:hypothetical protein